jgi:hypothetical protein
MTNIAKPSHDLLSVVPAVRRFITAIATVAAILYPAVLFRALPVFAGQRSLIKALSWTQH